MWSSWVKRKGTTQVMYIAKLKDGPKRVNKIFSMILERVFEMVWWKGRKWNHIKRDSWSFSFSSSFLFFFLSLFLCSVSWWLRGFDDIWGENHFFKKLLFNWLDMKWHGHDCGYTGSGRIFWNWVMHANIAKPWLWRCASCGYIGGGRIFWSGGMHANISGWG
jgi:hypothetical protein